MKPRVGFVLGDPSGIGPEVSARLLARPDVAELAEVIAVGDPEVLAAGERVAGVVTEMAVVETPEAALEAIAAKGKPVLLDRRLADRPRFPVGEASAVCGRYVLETLSAALGLARAGTIDAICFAPLNKQAMHLGGSPFEDELHWFAHELDYEGYLCELNTFDRLWTTRVTSHVALSTVAGMISAERVVQAVHMADRTLRAAGYERPRIAVAALNPHAGDGGLFGREEIDILAPAIARAHAEGIAAEGPYPSDTVFIKARDGDYDAVVTMYHDQGQIAMKLMGFDRGVTVQGGLPLPITTPAHGTAFDIVGQGKANVEATLAAFRLAARMGLTQRQGRGA